MQQLKHVVKTWIMRWVSPSSKQKRMWTLQKQVSAQNLTPEQRHSRAIKAQQLLDNDLFRDAVFAMQSDILSQLDRVKLDDLEGQRRLVMALQMSKTIEKQLWLLIQDGHEAVNAIQLRGKRID